MQAFLRTKYSSFTERHLISQHSVLTLPHTVRKTSPLKPPGFRGELRGLFTSFGLLVGGECARSPHITQSSHPGHPTSAAFMFAPHSNFAYIIILTCSIDWIKAKNRKFKCFAVSLRVMKGRHISNIALINIIELITALISNSVRLDLSVTSTHSFVSSGFMSIVKSDNCFVHPRELTKPETLEKHFSFFHFPRVCPSDQPLAEELADSAHEIGENGIDQVVIWLEILVFRF